MEETFREQRAATTDARSSMGVCRMWWATITDIVRMAPREHAQRAGAGHALRAAHDAQEPRLHARRGADPGPGHRRQHVDLQRGELRAAARRCLTRRAISWSILRQQGTKAGVTDMPFSVSEINDYRKRNRSLSALVEYHAMTFTLLGGTEPHRVRTGVVSAGFFQFLGVQARPGTRFRARRRDSPARAPVLILSYEFWKKQERGDPNIIGKKYQMNDRTHIVIGVLPAIPQYPDENDVYMTTTSCPFRSARAFIANRKRAHDARLRPSEAGCDPRPGARRSGLGRRPTGEGVSGIVHRQIGYGIDAARAARRTHARRRGRCCGPCWARPHSSC